MAKFPIRFMARRTWLGDAGDLCSEECDPNHPRAEWFWTEELVSKDWETVVGSGFDNLTEAFKFYQEMEALDPERRWRVDLYAVNDVLLFTTQVTGIDYRHALDEARQLWTNDILKRTVRFSVEEIHG